MQKYEKLAIEHPDDLVFGVAPKPVTTKSGLVIGGGTVYPEINFTLPPTTISADTMPGIRTQYQQMLEEACSRAVQLKAPGLVVEYELLPPMTIHPEWGAEITSVLRQVLDKFAANDGLKSALRVTPNDTREHERPPMLREGHLYESMVRSFTLNAQAGADLFSIESTGGKELHDDGIIMGDLKSVAFSLGVLAARDMAFLWDMIVEISRRYGVIPAGDSACGFGNTAMVLAEKRYIPKVWAAVIRVMTVARSLVAHERGAVGPGKDCAYENPYLKVITGCPMSGEGAESACAHLSPLGNIARVGTDLWSNESVQNVRLLGGMAPTVSLEQLVYATRLMNVASHHGPEKALLLRDWCAESDGNYDPQAYILKPEVVVELSREIIKGSTPYDRTRRAAVATLQCIRSAVDKGVLTLPEKELDWVANLSREADSLPDEEVLTSEMVENVDSAQVRLDQYNIA